MCSRPYKDNHFGLMAVVYSVNKQEVTPYMRPFHPLKDDLTIQRTRVHHSQSGAS